MKCLLNFEDHVVVTDLFFANIKKISNPNSWKIKLKTTKNLNKRQHTLYQTNTDYCTYLVVLSAVANLALLVFPQLVHDAAQFNWIKLKHSPNKIFYFSKRTLKKIADFFKKEILQIYHQSQKNQFSSAWFEMASLFAWRDQLRK